MLDNLALFLAIIDRNGLSAAGRQVGLSPASVSARLLALENHYGATLLTRTTRSLSLTDAGRVLAEGARRLLAENSALESRLRSAEHTFSGPIRFAAPVDLGHNSVVPIVDRFMATHPDISIELHLTDTVVDLAHQDFDFAISHARHPDSALKSREIAGDRPLLCASPAYLTRHGTPAHPDELIHHDCIIRRLGASAEHIWWFDIDGAPHAVAVRGRRSANNGQLLRRWALEGHGLCKTTLLHVRADLANARLVEVLGDFAGKPTTVHIVHPAARACSRRVIALIQVLAAELEQRVAPEPG